MYFASSLSSFCPLSLCLMTLYTLSLVISQSPCPLPQPTLCPLLPGMSPELLQAVSTYGNCCLAQKQVLTQSIIHWQLKGADRMPAQGRFVPSLWPLMQHSTRGKSQVRFLSHGNPSPYTQVNTEYTTCMGFFLRFMQSTNKESF